MIGNRHRATLSKSSEVPLTKKRKRRVRCRENKNGLQELWIKEDEWLRDLRKVGFRVMEEEDMAVRCQGCGWEGFLSDCDSHDEDSFSFEQKKSCPFCLVEI